MFVDLVLLTSAVGLLACVVLIPVVGWRAAAASALLLALCLAPWPLVQPDGSVRHFGIAGATPGLSTYGVVLYPTALLILLRRGRGATVTPYLWVVAIFLLAGLLWVWEGADAQWAGAQHLLDGALALVVGRHLGQHWRRDHRLQTWFAAAATGVFAVQLLLAVGQRLGYPLSPHAEVTYFMAEGRALGTFNHPGALGKVALLMLVVLLPLTRATRPVTRRFAHVAVILAAGGTVLTLSRANVIAVVAALVLWALFAARGSTLGRRFVSVLGGTAVAALAAESLLERFLSDPGGGDRGHLLRTGLHQIAQAPMRGTGPNYYSEVVGQHDALAAAGYPVHNTFLLGAAELGVVGAVVLFWPLLALLVRAVRMRSANGFAGDSARAVVATAPGVLLVACTGWGLLAGGAFVLWWLLIGVAHASMRPDDVDGPTPSGATEAVAPRGTSERGLNTTPVGGRVEHR